MKVLVVGDFCPKERVAELFNKSEFGSVLNEICPLISRHDYTIVNFECPVATDNDAPIKKVGPNLSCSEKAIDALLYAGFNCVTLANNHFLDYGQDGVRHTLEGLEIRGLEHVGGGRNIEEASKILYRSIGEETLAIINVCEHEFSIASRDTAGSNPLNPIRQYYDIVEAKKRANYVILIVHGGHELFQLPSNRMVETYKFFIDSGADAVINHHQHCYSGFEIYKEKPIFYGLGNFCFDNKNHRDDIWNYGYMVSLDFSVSPIHYELYPYRQCGDYPSIELLPPSDMKENLDKLNQIISNHDLLDEEIDHYYQSCNTYFSDIFEPFFNKHYLIAKHLGYLPSLVGDKRKLSAIDHILCESHRDKLLWWLTKK